MPFAAFKRVPSPPDFTRHTRRCGAWRAGASAPGGPPVLSGVKSRISREDLVLIICRDPSLVQVAVAAETILSRHRRSTFWISLDSKCGPSFMAEGQRAGRS